MDCSLKDGSFFSEMKKVALNVVPYLCNLSFINKCSWNDQGIAAAEKLSTASLSVTKKIKEFLCNRLPHLPDVVLFVLN